MNSAKMEWIQLFVLGMLLTSAAAENKVHSVPVDDKTQQDAQQKPTTTSTLQHEFRYAKLLDAGGLEKLKESASVGAVFFYKKRMRQLDTFFTEYDKSAGFLGAYGLTLAVVDCSAQVKELEPACKNASGDKIYTYRYGADLLDLDLDSMFDVNSIMSNILQLALLNEVTIIQSKRNRQVLEHENAGQTDIIYGYHIAIGTYEHRVFMEIAYAYHDKYKFILTTEPASIDGLQDSGRITPRSVCAMWVLYCRERYDAENGCRSVNYRGEFNLLELANFLRALSLPRVFHYPEDGIKSPCETDDSIGCVYIEYPVSAKEEVMKIVDSIQFDIHGTAGLVLTELKPEDGSPDSNKGPQLFVVRPGQTEKKMMDEKLYGGWALENVEYFLSEELFRSSNVPEEPAHSDDKELKEGEDGGRGVDEIDDMVLGVATEKRAKIAKIQNVPALTDKTFPSTVADSKLVVVLFYLLFDARSSVFLLHYQEAAEKLAALKGDDPSAHPLVRVNCYDWTDVCQKANITTYPQVHIYRNGQRQQYRRSLDKDVLVQTVWLLQQEQPLMLDTEMDVDKFAGGLLPEGADRMVDDVVLLKLSKSKKEMAAFEEVVKSLDTQMLFAVVGADVKAKFLPEAGVVHVRLTDVHQLMDKLTTNLDAESIKSFLLKGQFNLLPELTHKNFPALFARQLPFGILFVTGTGSYMQSVQRIIVDIIKSQTFPDLLFCKMTLDDTDTMAETILMEYAESMSLPTFAIVQHRQGKVFVLQDVDLTGAALTAWIQGVLDGSVTPTKMLKDGEWKPVGPYYDFLRMMDRDAEMKNSPESVKSYESCPSGNCDRPGETPESMQRSKEAEEMDVDIRANLLDLKHSRLYSSKDRRPHHHSPPAPAGMAGAEKSHVEAADGATDFQGKSTLPPREEL